MTGGEGTEERREKKPEEISNWERVVDLVQADFEEGRLAEENMWWSAVLIPKGKMDYPGIGLVEVMSRTERRRKAERERHRRRLRSGAKDRDYYGSKITQ